MKIKFRNKKFRRECESRAIRGPGIGKKVVQRIAEMRQLDNLQDFMRYLPHLHAHKLEPKSAGKFAVKVTGNFRLVFEPTDEDGNKTNPDDLSEIQAVRILSVEDYH